MTDRPLELLKGIRIAAFTQFLLGPAACQYLGDMGAEVVKVEPPAGAWERRWSGAGVWPNGWSAFHLLAHRNVRGLTVDLKHPDGREMARRLIAASDVVVENFRPGVMDRLGLSWEAARELNPRIVYASASGYGRDSPGRDRPGQDLLIQAVSGLVAATGQGSGSPTPAGAAVVDQHGAALLAMGILGALLHRERTGHGQRLEVTMLQAALDLQTEPAVYWLNGGRLERPSVPLGSMFHPAPYGVYRCADGCLVISIVPVRQVWEALGRPAQLEPWLDPGLAFGEREAIWSAVAGLLAPMTVERGLEVLRRGGVWTAPVRGYEDVFDDPSVSHLHAVLELEHPGAGPIRLLAHPIRYDSGEPTQRRPPPAVGEHTDEVLAELGYDAAEMRALRAAGAL